MPPEVLAWELGGSSVSLKARWWSRSRRTNVVHSQSLVIEAIKGALDQAGIDRPFPTQVVLLHDQTEDVDGMRGEQREGWPPRKGDVQPRPLRLIERSKEDADQTELPEPARAPEHLVQSSSANLAAPPAPSAAALSDQEAAGWWDRLTTGGRRGRSEERDRPSSDR